MSEPVEKSGRGIWWEQNWWVIFLLFTCLLVGFVCGFYLGNYFLEAR